MPLLASRAVSEPHKQAEIDSRTPQFMAREASKPFGWAPAHFAEWATIELMLGAVGATPGAHVLDVGCGSGWTTLFLAEAGYDALGLDLVAANVELCRERARRWGSSARFEVADMDALPAGEPADIALIFDALHHSRRQAAVLGGVGRRLAPGGWLLLGEPTWLHRLSPGARATTRELGWSERGLTLHGLRRDMRAAGFEPPRRFFQPTAPYESRVTGTLWQLARLLGASVLVAPHGHYWLAARRAP
jgi:SAM-dependent methyltransferase